ncbi:hypothetical protein BDZ90DRAFT_256861 [Jaminaea rosea]|uniref:Succinate dehydrogenase assembly factor 4, mitochondrial n=1 Tax=Jaminaea rosea TaxID=1569628 RepID=A0A316UK98_9BASI|nr:hypothetical protein BDZ90DRAFT_256861 [Jaminaea rosea]PWN24393.1 hypothetical protein BDZ90DRAFT_256861 [Jaminaea rosea]
MTALRHSVVSSMRAAAPRRVPHPFAASLLSRAYSSGSSSSSSGSNNSAPSKSSKSPSLNASNIQPPPTSKFNRPSPPTLPAAEQAEFNRLVAARSGQLQFNRPAPTESDKEGELHPNARRLPTPDFEGDTNPETGEVGGPKKDPLIWRGEYTYNGRATDF